MTLMKWDRALLLKLLKVKMKLLIDTHLLLWAAADMLPKQAIDYFEDLENELHFSPASIWEVVIKNGLNRSDFRVNPTALYRGLLENGYKELEISSNHAILTAGLPLHHKDPFDRILLAQARAEGLALLSADRALSHFSPVIFVG